MMLLAAIEHHARHIWATVTEAITERARGFSDREAGDFLTATERARQQLVEREAEEEVAEPRVIDDGPPYILGVDFKVGVEYCLLCCENLTNVTYHACPVRASQNSAHACADPASAGTPAAEAPSPAAGVVPPAPAAGLPTRRPLPELLYAAAEAVSMPVTWGGAKQPAWRTRLAAELGDRAAELNRDAADARIAKRLNDAGFKAGEDFSAALDG